VLSRVNLECEPFVSSYEDLPTNNPSDIVSSIHQRDSLIKMPVETKISTAIPANVNVQFVTEHLHDHDFYIKTTCPQLISYKHVSGSSEVGQPCVYEVTDKRPIGQTTYKLTLTNQSDGIDSHVDGKAPTGAMTIKTKWRVVGDKLEEAVEIDSNMIMNKMIKGNVEKSHPEHHQGFITAAKA
jgi:hypothetical protein